MRKKGMEMSFNVIIVAVIGLLILVILAYLVVNKVSVTNNTTNTDCSTKAGICQADSCGDKEIPNTNCAGTPKPYCCKIV